MNTATPNARICPACHQAPLAEVTREKQFRPLGKTVTVALRVSRCPACGTELINAEQRRENLQLLRNRKAEYGHLLMGEEIVALRKKYGLTQQAAARIFGKGKIAFSRYENETSYPDQSTTKLLRQAIARPEVLKALADEEGVDVPLWHARLEDEREEALLHSLSLHDAGKSHLARLQALFRVHTQATNAKAREQSAVGVVFAPQQTALASCNEDSFDEALVG